VLVTGLVFSYMNGIIHPYYMVALAPGIAALAGIGAMGLWQARPGSGPLAGRIAAAAGVLASAVWAFILLDRTPDWLPWLRWVVLVAGVAAAGLVLAGPALARLAQARLSLARRGRLALAVVPLALALVAGLAGPAAYALDTVGTAHTGAIPSAGPQAAGFGGPGGGLGGRGGFPGAGQAGRGTAGTGAPGGTGASGATGTPNGNGASSGSTAPGGTAGTGAASGGMPGGTSTGGMPRGGFGAGNGPGGGLGGDTTVSSALKRLLEKDAASYTWVAATEGSEGAAPLELATGDAVMAIGGFNGTDPWPTLAVFKELVARHEIHYYVGQGSQSFGGGHGSSAIAAWVSAHFTKQTVGGQTVYDLTKPLS
jgi:4-amino-4-deoxy-L-arabinose transferase-like glycosyltransferase